jgi:hypothetical protein
MIQFPVKLLLFLGPGADGGGPQEIGAFHHAAHLLTKTAGHHRLPSANSG